MIGRTASRVASGRTDIPFKVNGVAVRKPPFASQPTTPSFLRGGGIIHGVDNVRGADPRADHFDAEMLLDRVCTADGNRSVAGAEVFGTQDAEAVTPMKATPVVDDERSVSVSVGRDQRVGGVAKHHLSVLRLIRRS